MRVIVTGVAGDIGNGIGRILRDCSLVDKVIGCDIHFEHAGHRVFDECVIVPVASSADYIHTLRGLWEKYEADAIVVTSEPELRVLSGLAADGVEVNLPFVTANQLSMQVGFDKLKTANFVSSLGRPVPWTWLVEARDPDSYPCILKSRTGAGSKSVYLVRDNKNLMAYRALFPDYIWQEYIPSDESEFTCGVYGCSDGEIRTIIFRRRLVSGVTGYAELAHDAEIDSLCVAVAKALGLKGSINIQLRMSARGPMIFEINPRFSSTVVFRHKLGFTDVIWSLQDQILGLKTTYSPRHALGARIYRVFDEIVSE